MVRWLFAATVCVCTVLLLVSNPITASTVASSMFVVGLLVIIAVNVQTIATNLQPQRKAVAPSPVRPRRDFGADPDVDGDLFEDFEDPYAEGLVDHVESEPNLPPSRVRVNPRRTSRA